MSAIQPYFDAAPIGETVILRASRVGDPRRANSDCGANAFLFGCLAGDAAELRGLYGDAIYLVRIARGELLAGGNTVIFLPSDIIDFCEV